MNNKRGRKWVLLLVIASFAAVATVSTASASEVVGLVGRFFAYLTSGIVLTLTGNTFGWFASKQGIEDENWILRQLARSHHRTAESLDQQTPPDSAEGRTAPGALVITILATLVIGSIVIYGVLGLGAVSIVGAYHFTGIILPVKPVLMDLGAIGMVITFGIYVRLTPVIQKQWNLIWRGW